MGDKVESAPAPAVTTPKKPAKAKKPRVKANHPPASGMVTAAIKALKERNGSSLQAIKKYIVATYKLDAEKQAPFIKKYLKSAVANGTLVQTKGKGAAGSFKLPTSKSEAKPKSKTAAKPKTLVSKAKKPTSPKKAAPKAKKVIAEKKKPAKVAAKPPKAKSTAAKSKVSKASLKKPKASPRKSAAKPKKTAAKKVGKK